MGGLDGRGPGLPRVPFLCLSCLSATWLHLGLCVLGQTHVARQQVRDEVQDPRLHTCWGVKPELPGLRYLAPSLHTHFQYHCPSAGHSLLPEQVYKIKHHLLMSEGLVGGPQSLSPALSLR